MVVLSLLSVLFTSSGGGPAKVFKNLFYQRQNILNPINSSTSLSGTNCVLDSCSLKMCFFRLVSEEVVRCTT